MRRGTPLAILMALAALIVCFGAAAARTEPRQFGNVIYDLPPGWTAGATENGVLNILSDLPGDRCEFCRIYLGPSRKGAGSPVAFLPSQTGVFVADDEKSDVRVVSGPEAMTLGGHKAAMAGISVGGDVQIIIAVRLGDRFQLLGFYGSVIQDGDLQEAMAVFTEQAAPFFESLAYVSEGAKGLLPDPVPGDLSGLWWGWKNSWVMQLDLTMAYRMDQRRIVFWPDGQFYDGLPPEGLKRLDRRKLIDAGNTDFGVYAVQGSDLRLTFADGRTEVLPRRGADWVDGERALGRVEALPDGSTIKGAVSTFSYTGFAPGSGVSGGISSGSDTIFRKDGTYDGSSFGGAFGGFEGLGGDTTGGYATSGETPHGGRYEIRDGLLIQHPSDGSPPRQSLIYRAGGDIMIGDLFLKTGE